MLFVVKLSKKRKDGSEQCILAVLNETQSFPFFVQFVVGSTRRFKEDLLRKIRSCEPLGQKSEEQQVLLEIVDVEKSGDVRLTRDAMRAKHGASGVSGPRNPQGRMVSRRSDSWLAF